MKTARATAIANNDRAIEESQSRAIAAREAQTKPRNALEAMAQRLQVSTDGLQNTLMGTVFKDCSREEFMALVIVSNTYGLNPLLKEIYAFPKRGGGIVPMVGIDGWIRLANEHPQFDGIEFEHIEDDNGNIRAMEGILYRKDRERPIKMLIETDEFKVDSNPNWKSRPRHMTWVRCYCQTVRVGLGLTGLGVEGVDDNGDARDVTVSLPPKQSLAEELGDEIPDHNSETGEVVEEEQEQRDERGMTEVDEETARQLDAGEAIDEESEVEEEEQAEEVHESSGEDEKSPTDQWLADLRLQIENADSVAAVNLAGAEWDKNRVVYPEGTITEFDGLLKAAYQRVRSTQSGR